jgi:putative thioredoxin
MMTSDFIVNVSEADFEYEVLAFSQQVPVVVDFWAEWCGPCRTLGPMLESMAQEAQGSFRLAKVNVDENPNLALRYGIHSIPAVKAFRNGTMVAEFAGVQPEPRLREFLRSIAPSRIDLAVEKGQSLLNLSQPNHAEQAFREALVSAPGNTAALLGLAKSLLLQGEYHESQVLLEAFPTSKEYSAAHVLLPLTDAMLAVENGEYSHEESPLDAAFERAIHLIERGNLEAALDGLLDILRENKNYRSGKARLVIVAVLELLGADHPATRQYRNELASVLF